MNTLSHTFADLLQLLKLEPADDYVEVLLAQVAAGVAAAPCAVLLALVTPATLAPANAAVWLLTLYGVVFSSRLLTGSRLLLYAEIGDPEPGPYAGAVVL